MWFPEGQKSHIILFAAKQQQQAGEISPCSSCRFILANTYLCSISVGSLGVQPDCSVSRPKCQLGRNRTIWNKRKATRVSLMSVTQQKLEMSQSVLKHSSLCDIIRGMGCYPRLEITQVLTPSPIPLCLCPLPNLAKVQESISFLRSCQCCFLKKTNKNNIVFNHH